MVTESFCELRSQFLPAGDCVAGDLLYPCDGRNTDTFYCQPCDFVELPARLVKAIIWRIPGGIEGFTAGFASVPPTFSLPGTIQCVADDVALSDFILKRTVRVRAALISDGFALHLHVPETCSRHLTGDLTCDMIVS